MKALIIAAAAALSMLVAPVARTNGATGGWCQYGTSCCTIQPTCWHQHG
jgi:hypothetical protein